jgi:predicted DCC family thiol-disulfide oxidoreductase YuxK
MAISARDPGTRISASDAMGALKVNAAAKEIIKCFMAQDMRSHTGKRKMPYPNDGICHTSDRDHACDPLSPALGGAATHHILNEMEVPMTKSPKTRALYNGDCPVCDTEMCAYDRYSRQTHLDIDFHDLTSGGLDTWGVTEDAATRLLHVEHDGRRYIGFEAMVILWEQMPRYRWMARISRLPGLYPVLDWGYKHIVARWIYTRHQSRKAKGLI